MPVAWRAAAPGKHRGRCRAGAPAPGYPRAARHVRRAAAPRSRSGALVMLTTGVLAVCGGACGLAVAASGGRGPPQVPLAPVAAPAGPATPRPVRVAGPPATPVGLVIPAIGVRARLVRLGLSAAGTLQVPGGTAVAGWYTGSSRPGAIGAAVIVGHVDSRPGPGVFYRLRSLHPRDRVYVRRADGTLAVYTVTSVRLYAKARFPAAAVYGPAPDAQLRLITCGGAFDPALGSYLANVVVAAVSR